MSNYHRLKNIDFSEIDMSRDPYTWYYSYKELQDMLNDVCKNHTLKKVYVELGAFLEADYHGENYYDFSYSNSMLFLLFDNIAIDLYVESTGMIKCRTIDLYYVLIKNIKDFPLEELDETYGCFYELSNEFRLPYAGQKVTEVVVDNVNIYPYSLDSFDNEKAKASAAANELPNNIHFKLANGVYFGIYADNIESFYIELKK